MFTLHNDLGTHLLPGIQNTIYLMEMYFNIADYLS